MDNPAIAIMCVIWVAVWIGMEIAWALKEMGVIQ